MIQLCVFVAMVSSTIANSQPGPAIAMERDAVSEALGNALLKEGLPSISSDSDPPLPPPCGPPPSNVGEGGAAAEAEAKPATSTTCLVHTGMEWCIVWRSVFLSSRYFLVYATDRACACVYFARFEAYDLRPSQFGETSAEMVALKTFLGNCWEPVVIYIKLLSNIQRS